MSDNKKHKFDGSTYQEVIVQTMQNGTMAQAASKLIKDFAEDQKETTLKPVHHISSIADQLKLLLEKLEEQENKQEEDNG